MTDRFNGELGAAEVENRDQLTAAGRRCRSAIGGSAFLLVREPGGAGCV